MNRSLFLITALITCACATTDPDPYGRLTGTTTDGGTRGCPEGFMGRTLHYFSALNQNHALWIQQSQTWCCPAGSSPSQCPGGSLAASTCLGTWPGETCSTQPHVGTRCTSNADCGSGLSCATIGAQAFCTRRCTDEARSGAPDPCLTNGGTCLPLSGTSEWYCLPHCGLPSRGADSESNPDFANCDLGICAPAPNENDPVSRRGICYPSR